MTVFTSRGRDGKCHAKNPATCRYHMKKAGFGAGGFSVGGSGFGQSAFKPSVQEERLFRADVRHRCDQLGLSYAEVGCA